jgi:hypothetical protein
LLLGTDVAWNEKGSDEIEHQEDRGSTHGALLPGRIEKRTNAKSEEFGDEKV